MSGLEMKFVEEAFSTNWISPVGPNISNFEKEVSELVGIKSAVALTSGTAAIHLALKVIGIKKDDLVFCSSLTFCGSCNPIIYEGAIPVFVDSDPESYCISTIALEKAFIDCEKKGKLPKALIVVNLYGQSSDMDKIRDLCNKYKTLIIEDSAESLGATYKGQASGTLGDIGIYSFNGNKIITTSGGGILISNNEEYVEKARFLSTQAKENKPYYHHLEIGYNYRMSNVSAGIGRGQLTVLKDRVEKKKYIFEKYKEEFKDIKEIEMMPIKNYGESNYWLSVITIKEDSKIKPTDLIEALEKENIEARHIWKPMNLQPVFYEYEFYSHNEDGVISVGEDIFNRGLCLPSDTKMTDLDIHKVSKIVKNLFR
ncbi:DegT/DnrJ/EryC1/StrS family aminotransferase [Clostridium sp.]|uniref:DegT/DnrJ/EryC1/StrS family aminotransferase n=1 Tax=Clostridium sp. TaxID=1506 RepID=UPI003F372960